MDATYLLEMKHLEYKDLDYNQILDKLKDLEKRGYISLDMHDDIQDSQESLRRLRQALEIPVEVYLKPFTI